MRWLFISTMSIGLIGCSSIERSAESGYQSSQPSISRSSPKKSNSSSQRARLRQLEAGLTARKDLDQYSKALPFLVNDSEKIEFLSLDDFERKQEWLSQKKVFSRGAALEDTFADLIRVKDLAVGMTQSHVRRSWGEPEGIEVSGNPSFRNEKWKYSRYVSTTDGYRSEKRFVYFEGGRVVGWEIE